MDGYPGTTDWKAVSHMAGDMAKSAGLSLIRRGKVLILTDGSLELAADLTSSLHRLKRSNLKKELIVRAALGRKNTAAIHEGGTPPIAVDATAGLGEDSLLLSAAGYAVHLYEANPVIAMLLRDALERASDTEELSGTVSRMELHFGDSIRAMQNLPFHPEIILLDPMFPARQKSGLVKKKFQLLKLLESPCGDEEALLLSACAARPQKILVKRPAKGPHLAGRKPSYSVMGNTIRVDCIICDSRILS